MVALTMYDELYDLETHDLSILGHALQAEKRAVASLCMRYFDEIGDRNAYYRCEKVLQTAIHGRRTVKK